MEEFIEIKELPGYFINRCGDVLSKKRREDNIIYASINRGGYKVVMLSIRGQLNTYYVARLVLSAFVGYPADPWLCVVNYKDGDRTNCNLDNLEWLICETSEDYDPTKSHRKGVLKPKETKSRMTQAKLNQSEETILKGVESRKKTYLRKKLQSLLDDLGDKE